MPGIVRLGDQCSGHSCYPPRENSSASKNVFVNGKGVHRVGDSWKKHKCKRRHGNHAGNLKKGSSTVFVNGRGVGRKGDPVSCGSKCDECSDDVFSG